jgi:S1-C subfamily serine protease
VLGPEALQQSPVAWQSTCVQPWCTWVPPAREDGAGPQPPARHRRPLLQGFFNQFFGSEGPARPGAEYQQPGLGSGVIIDKRGLVLTNFHVGRGPDEIIVRLSDKKEYRSQLPGTDSKTVLRWCASSPTSMH